MKPLSILLALACAAFAAEGPARPDMLIDAEKLEEHLGDSRLIVLHVGTQKDYDAGHIPGARLATLADLSITGEGGLRLELPSPGALAETLGRLGTTANCHVVVYPATESVQSATRVWFTLDWAGYGERASLLDGGLAAWRAAGKPLATDAPRVTATKPPVKPRPEIVVDAAFLRAHAAGPELALLDARTPEYYSGADPGMMPRAGHIPGARNLPFSELLDASRKLKPAAELRRLFAERGAVAGKPLTVYCHIGQQATLLYFAARYVGLEPRLYDGSFQDWSNRSELPVEGSVR
jgi:thiosulfate/3-mercaptopyruvate sulfurtransferase